MSLPTNYYYKIVGNLVTNLTTKYYQKKCIILTVIFTELYKFVCSVLPMLLRNYKSTWRGVATFLRPQMDEYDQRGALEWVERTFFYNVRYKLNVFIFLYVYVIYINYLPIIEWLFLAHLLYTQMEHGCSTFSSHHVQRQFRRYW